MLDIGRITVSLGVLLLGCGPAVLESSPQGDTSGSSGRVETSGSTSSTMPPVGTSNTSGGSSTSPGPTDATGDTSDDGSFLPTDPRDTTCDPFQQDCPDGEKCIAYADRGSVWDTVGCFPVVRDPGLPGDACTMQDNPFSGLDDCQEGAMCWDVDPATLQGTCVALCTGSLEQPACADPSARCIISDASALNVCLSTCDPLLQDCNAGFTCRASRGDFVCTSEEAFDPMPEGGACEFVEGCEPGATCIPASDYGPGCDTSDCCSNYCDTTDPDCPNPDHACVGLDDLPLGLEWLGLCRIAP